MKLPGFIQRLWTTFKSPSKAALWVLLLIYAAWHDVSTMTIPNWVSIVLAVTFIPAALTAGLSLEEIGWAGWATMMIFLAELLIGFAYAWKKGALDWE